MHPKKGVDSCDLLKDCDKPHVAVCTRAGMCKSQAGSGCTSAVHAASKDLEAQRREFYFPLPAQLTTLIQPALQDQRDLPILHLFWNVSVTALPAAATIFALSSWSAVLGPIYLACCYAAFLERFLLALHYSEHRKLFKTDHLWRNYFAPVALAPLFGVPCGLYRFHHCVMHHIEGNWFPKDLSSTEPYQRDNVGHFLLYWLRYLIGIWVELPLYAIKAHRWQMALQCLSWEGLYVAVIAALWRLNATATVWTILVPLVITSFALMFGNWSQHIFIDPAMPRSPHGMAYSCVAFSGNQQSFNDGYHTAHHLNSKLHWTQLPQRFIDLVNQGQQTGLVFEGIGFFEVGFAVFAGKLEWLAERLIPVDRTLSVSKAVSMLRHRLEPVHVHRPTHAVHVH